MSAKHLFACLLLTAVPAVGTAQAQPSAPQPGSPSATIPPVNLPSTPSSAIVNPSTMPQPVSPSAAEWLNSPFLCNGPTGKNGPIGSEFFVMSGPTVPIGPSIQDAFSNTGWMVEGGARTLFFNRTNDAAWTAVLAAHFQYNNGSGRPPAFPFFGNPAVPVTIRSVDRYGLTFAGGRDWFLNTQMPAFLTGTSLRVGAELGGRWGYEHVDFNLIINDPTGRSDFLEHSGTYGEIYLGTHADLEVPMGSWVWVTGFHVEWGLNFSNVVVGQNNTGQDLNFLLSTGFRY